MRSFSVQKMFLMLIVAIVIIESGCEDVVISTFETNRDECNELNSASTNIKCKVCDNIINCLLDIDKGETTFGLVSSEDAIISAQFLQNTIVAAEIRDAIRYRDPYQEEVVVVAKNLASTNLQNAKYCHIDEKANQWVKYGSLIFQDFVLSTNKDYSLKPTDVFSISEYRYKILNSFLGDSCIPHAKLPKLCKTCTHPKNCTYSTNGLIESVNCFNKGGNIAITTKNMCKNMKAVGYICMNNSLSTIPCSWFSIPWPLIITRRDNFQKTKKFLTNMFVDFTQENIDQRPYVRVLLYPEATDEISFLEKEVKLDSYIGATHTIIQKKHRLRWCVISKSEAQKCLWIKWAAFYGGIHLNITCDQLPTREACIIDVMENSSDLSIMSKRFSPLFRNIKIQGLEAISHTRNYNPLKSLILVKSKDVNSLEGKSGCFSGYQDEAFLSFMAHRKDYNPNFHEQLKNLSPSTDESIMCDSSKCITLSTKKQNNIKATMDCLKDHDFAVVIEDQKLLSQQNIFVLCDERVVSYSTKLQPDCYLSSINDMFIVRKNFGYKTDVLELFSYIERMERFKLFKPFAGESHVLFEDDSLGIVQKKPDERNDPFLIIRSAKIVMDRKEAKSNSYKHDVKLFYVMGFYVCKFVCKIVL